MSHIPASAMPHAAPHHHEDEPGPAQDMAATMEPSATAIFADTPSPTAPEPAPAQTETPAASAPVATPAKQDSPGSSIAAKARSGWSLAALAVGGAALVAGVLTFRSRKKEA